MASSKGDYVPRSSVQSWTIYWRSAAEFAHHEMTTNDFVIVEADLPEKDMLFNVDFLNAISYRELNREENEVIRLSRKPVKAKFWRKEEYAKV